MASAAISWNVPTGFKELTNRESGDGFMKGVVGNESPIELSNFPIELTEDNFSIRLFENTPYTPNPPRYQTHPITPISLPCSPYQTHPSSDPVYHLSSILVHHLCP